MSKSLIKFMGPLLVAAVLLFNACDDNSSSPQNNFNIAKTVQSQSNLSSLSELITGHGLTDTLSQDGPVTLFAPSNDALSKADLSGSSDKEIKSALEYHIVPLNLTYENLQSRDSAETLNGNYLYFTTEGNSVIINGGQAVITSTGTEATNGIIFTIDTLLTTPEK